MNNNITAFIFVFGIAIITAMTICLIPNSPRIVSHQSSEAETKQTRQSILLLQRDAVPVRRSLGFFEVTAYCPCERCCGEYADGVTADGHVIRLGDRFVAADSMIPFGKVLDVPGYGVVPVLDRGGAIRDKKLDVFFPTHLEALKWGRQTLEIHCWVTK